MLLNWHETFEGMDYQKARFWNFYSFKHLLIILIWSLLKQYCSPSLQYQYLEASDQVGTPLGWSARTPSFRQGIICKVWSSSFEVTFRQPRTAKLNYILRWDQNWLWQVYVCNSLHSEELLITKITSLLHKQAINTWLVFTMLPMVHFTRTTTLSRTASKIRPCNCWNVLLSLTVASPG